MPEIEYQFQFTSSLQNPNTFLYNTGPITALDSPTWNARQTYSVVRFDAGKPPKKHGRSPGPDAKPGPAFSKGPTSSVVLGTNLPCPPCNIGPHSTPNYELQLGHPAVQSLATGETVFCGQRNDPFYVDLGAVFDLADLRPFQGAFAIPPFAAGTEGIDATKQLNIHSIAIQVPISTLTRDGSVPTNVLGSSSVLGIWSAASRTKMRMFDDHKNSVVESGPWVQVSRLGNPLFNEGSCRSARRTTERQPVGESEYLTNVQHPELGNLIANVLYPVAFPNLAAYTKARAAWWRSC